MMTTSVDPITPIIKQDQPPVESPRVYIRRIRSSDRQQVVALSQSNQKFHYPWITAPLTAHMYRNYMRPAATRECRRICGLFENYRSDHWHD